MRIEIDDNIKEIMTNEIDLEILRALLSKDFYLKELAQGIGIAYKNLFPHIRKLEKAGLIETEKKKNTRGQKVIVTSKRYDATGKGTIHQDIRDLFKGKMGKKGDRILLEVIKQLENKGTIESIVYLSDMSIIPAWRKITGLIEEGYVRAKLEITSEGEKHLEKLKKNGK